MSAAKWTEADIPDQAGHVALVTGANSGIGFEAARALAEHGATVLLGCRDAAKGADAITRIHASAPDADVTVLPLDLADLSSVRAAAAHVNETHPRLDLLGHPLCLRLHAGGESPPHKFLPQCLAQRAIDLARTGLPPRRHARNPAQRRGVEIELCLPER